MGDDCFGTKQNFIRAHDFHAGNYRPCYTFIVIKNTEVKGLD